MNVDDALRRFRTSIPGPTDALVARIVDSATGGARTSHRRRLRASSRTVFVGVSVITALVVIVALGALMRGGAGPSAAPAAPGIPSARVDWGMVATVKLTPDPGISIEETRTRFTEALAFRTHDNDGAGVEVLSTSGDEATLRLPGAQVKSQVEEFLRFNRLVVVDEKDVLASGDSIKDIEAAAARLIGPGTPVAYYVQSYLQGYGWSQPTRYSSRTSAEKRMKDDPDKGAMIAVPADLVVVGGDSGPRLQPVGLIRPGAYIPSSSVRVISMEGTRVTLAIDRGNRPSAGSRVRVLTDPTGAVQPGSSTVQAGTAEVMEDGRLSVDSRYSTFSLEVPRVDFRGQVELLDTATYGRHPDAPGEPLAKALQPKFVPPSGGSDVSSWRQLLTGRFDDRDYVLAAGMRGDAVAALMVTDLGRSVNARGGGGSGGPDGVICPNGIGTPRVVRCGSMGGGGPIDGKRNGPSVMWTMDYGRVQPGVARIVMTFDGVQREAVIKDGWWLTHITVDMPTSPSSTGRDNLRDGITSVGPPTLSAWDDDGNPVPVSPPEAIRN